MKENCVFLIQKYVKYFYGNIKIGWKLQKVSFLLVIIKNEQTCI